MSLTSATSLAAARPDWVSARRVVVKIGSALLADRATGTLKRAWLASLMDDVASLARAGKDIVLVSSGAIALGRHALKLPNRPLALEESQAAAAVGQISLAHAYQELARERGLTAAQILLTRGDTEERRPYLNARHTLEQLLALARFPSSTRTTRLQRAKSATATTIGSPRRHRRDGTLRLELAADPALLGRYGIGGGEKRVHSQPAAMAPSGFSWGGVLSVWAAPVTLPFSSGPLPSAGLDYSPSSARRRAVVEWYPLPCTASCRMIPQRCSHAIEATSPIRA